MSRSKMGLLNTPLEVSVDDVVDLKVLVVIAERVEQRLCHLDPAHVAEELDDGEEGDVKVRGVALEGGGVDGGAGATFNRNIIA